MAFDLMPWQQLLAWIFMIYVLSASAVYLVLNGIAYSSLREYARNKRLDTDLSLYTGLEPPITVIVPAFNEGTTIVSSVQSILQLHYPNLEVVIVNDGSRDNTLDALIKAFRFEPFEEAVRSRIDTKTVKQVYLSRAINNLRLVDKENGGKADAINVGINIARSPLFCCVDADSVLEPASLLKIVQPFLDNL
ncbi:MAG: glycosyltransferase family 2 protein, partial [Proteobacteria bacterium]|nr:glycosyltransferase family 2 protein [Pseudomonadota bacterium]